MVLQQSTILMKDLRRRSKMRIGCLAEIPLDPPRLFLTAASFSIALLTFFILKKFNLSTKFRVGLIYSHLVTLLFPFILFTTSAACSAMCVQSCYSSIYNLVAYSLPTTIVLSSITGFFVIPALFIFSSKKEITNQSLLKFVRKYSKLMKINTPKVYLIDKAKPIAFSFSSFKSAIFLSVGLIDILNKKEIEAIILHELAHVKNRSSLLKVSNFIFRISPLSIISKFSSDNNGEERLADIFAARIQKTFRHVNSAKRKLDNFESP